jgi:hypothetical protein
MGRGRLGRSLLCSIYLCPERFDHVALSVNSLAENLQSSATTDAPYDLAPGDVSIFGKVDRVAGSGIGIYTIGLVVAVVLTATSFWIANTSLLWALGVPMGLVVLAIAQMGVHLVFPAHYHRARQH